MNISLEDHLDNLNDIAVDIGGNIEQIQKEINAYCDVNDLDSSGFEVVKDYDEQFDEFIVIVIIAEN